MISWLQVWYNFYYELLNLFKKLNESIKFEVKTLLSKYIIMKYKKEVKNTSVEVYNNEG